MAPERNPVSHATRKRPPGRGPTFAALLAASGKSPALIEVESGVSVTTTYRARGGHVPTTVHVRALAVALNVTEAECRAAIQRSKARRDGAS